MTTREMIKENNRLREQMTPANRDYVEDVIVFVRSERVNQAEAEKKLLKLAETVLEEQKHGRSAADVLGPDPNEYAQTLVDSLPAVKPVEGIKYYIMIPWIALTWLFLVEALIGFAGRWAGREDDTLTHISLLTILIVAIGSIVLIEAVMKFSKSSKEESNARPKVNLRAIGIYLIILIAVMVIGYSFRSMLPVFTVSPWVSLILFIIGLVGQKFIFMRK